MVVMRAITFYVSRVMCDMSRVMTRAQGVAAGGQGGRPAAAHVHASGGGNRERGVSHACLLFMETPH